MSETEVIRRNFNDPDDFYQPSSVKLKGRIGNANTMTNIHRYISFAFHYCSIINLLHLIGEIDLYEGRFFLFLFCV